MANVAPEGLADITLPIIQTEPFSKHLREKAIRLDRQAILITRFDGSGEERDFSVPTNCQGFGRIHHFRLHQGDGWPPNPLPIQPASRSLMIEAPDVMLVQVFQNAVCNWRCWYCFVDFALLAGDQRYSEFKTAKELIDLYEAEQLAPRVIDLSGGQPDLVPEWSIWTLEELERRGTNQIYLWSDDNLSNDYLWRYLTAEQIAKLAGSNRYGRVGCFKGFNEESFAFNTKADPSLFDRQFRLMRRIVDANFDVYGYATFTAKSSIGVRKHIADFVDRLQDIHPLFPLRTIPLRVAAYTPTQGRLDDEKRRALDIQEEAVAAWLEELSTRFEPELRSKNVTQHRINEH